MKLCVDKQSLNQATLRAQGAISDRALAQIGILAKPGCLELAATDRVLAVYSTMSAEISREGVVFVPGKLFSDVIRQLPEGQVMLESDGVYLIITSLSPTEFMMKIPLIEDMSWKAAPELASQNRASISAAKILYMIAQVQFCIEHDSPRNYGAVGYLHKPEAGKLRLVGTDGFRLSYCDTNVDLPENFLKTGICLSKRTLNELHRMASEGFEEIELAISDEDTTVLMSAPHYTIFARLSAVKYPNYRGVLPTANLYPINLSRPNLQSITRRVLLAADKTNAVRMSFNQSSLVLSSRTIGSSESKEEIKISDYRGAKSKLSVNGKFLNDVFSTIPGDELTLQFKSAEDPIVIIPREEPAECRSMHVLVPIRENS